MALEKISDQFGGLPMESLIGGPLQAACDAQVMLANATSNFIENVGFSKNADGKSAVRTVDFSFNRAITDAEGKPGTETVGMKVPLLAIVKIPSLSVESVDVSFDMEVKSSESSKTSDDKTGELTADGKLKIGPFSMKVSIKGSVASHKENARSSDSSAKYHVQIRATQGAIPEGLSRVLDILNTAITPTETKNDLKVIPATPVTPGNPG